MEEDDVLQDVLDDSIEDEELDRLNKERRKENRTTKLMELYPYMEFEVCHWKYWIVFQYCTWFIWYFNFVMVQNFIGFQYQLHEPS